MSKLTDWEVGQDICAISDFISEKMVELKDRKELYFLLDECRRNIGDYFNRHHVESHGFGLISHNESSDITPRPNRGETRKGVN